MLPFPAFCSQRWMPEELAWTENVHCLVCGLDEDDANLLLCDCEWRVSLCFKRVCPVCFAIQISLLLISLCAASFPFSVLLTAFSSYIHSVRPGSTHVLRRPASGAQLRLALPRLRTTQVRGCYCLSLLIDKGGCLLSFCQSSLTAVCAGR